MEIKFSASDHTQAQRERTQATEWKNCIGRAFTNFTSCKGDNRFEASQDVNQHLQSNSTNFMRQTFESSIWNEAFMLNRLDIKQDRDLIISRGSVHYCTLVQNARLYKNNVTLL